MLCFPTFTLDLRRETFWFCFVWYVWPVLLVEVGAGKTGVYMHFYLQQITQTWLLYTGLVGRICNNNTNINSRPQIFIGCALESALIVMEVCFMTGHLMLCIGFALQLHCAHLYIPCICTPHRLSSVVGLWYARDHAALCDSWVLVASLSSSLGICCIPQRWFMPHKALELPCAPWQARVVGEYWIHIETLLWDALILRQALKLCCDWQVEGRWSVAGTLNVMLCFDVYQCLSISFFYSHKKCWCVTALFLSSFQLSFYTDFIGSILHLTFW